MTLGIHAEFLAPILMLVIMGCSLGCVVWHVNSWFCYPPVPTKQHTGLVGAIVWFQFVAMVISLIVVARLVG